MKVCLINPPIRMKYKPSQIYYPTGMLYVASSLRQHGHKVKVIDAPAMNWRTRTKVTLDIIQGKYYQLGLGLRDIIALTSAFRPDVVGITIGYSLQAPVAYELSSMIRKELRKPVIFGGPHSTVKPEECLKYADYVIAREGELSTPKLLDQIKAGKRPSKLTVSPIIEDLDALPSPSWDLIPTKAYFEAAKDRKMAMHGISNMDRWISIITSRGCPYNCIFCVISRTMGRKWRARSAENVLAELDLLVKRFGITDVTIEDDNATLDGDRMEAICDGVIKRGYKLNFYVPNGIRSDTLDKPLMVKMKAAGFRELWIAPESGVQRVVDEVIDKNLDLESVEQVIKWGREIGLKVSCFFVVGLPGETLDEIYKTISYAKRMKGLGMKRFSWGFATPYWGTRLYEICVKKGYLRKGFNNESIAPNIPTIITPDWTLEDLEKVRHDFKRRNW